MDVVTANAKISLRNDYSEGAHPRLLQALAVASAEINRGYGLDAHSERAAALIRDRLGRDADVHFLAGGTQTNLVALAAEMRLQFSDTRAETSREVAVTVRDAQGNHLIAPLTLEQRPAATAPEACAPGTP